MQINLLATAAVCGALALVCWFMAARNKRPLSRGDAERFRPGMYLRSRHFTFKGNVWRWGYIIFNTLAVASALWLAKINLF